MLQHLKSWWLHRKLYVIADPADSGVTLSRALFNHIRKNAKGDDVPQVFVFRTSTGNYGFAVNPALPQETQLCNIQYNSKYKCIGFETLCPTVARIFYDYGIACARRCKLSVTIKNYGDGNIFYCIERPHAKVLKWLNSH